MQVFYHDKYKESSALAKVFDVDSTSTNVKYSGNLRIQLDRQMQRFNVHSKVSLLV